jgi:hypothetical protein
MAFRMNHSTPQSDSLDRYFRTACFVDCAVWTVLVEGGVLVANRDQPKHERPRLWAEDRGPISELLTVPASFKAKYKTQV